MTSDWKEFEELIREYLIDDKAVTVPGSGNAKGEEDIIGYSTLCQCKFSDRKNVSILRRDIGRLIAAGKLQNKVPLFASKSNGKLLLTVLDSPYLKSIIRYIVAIASADRVIKDISLCNDIKTLNDIDTYINSTFIPINTSLSNKLYKAQRIVNKAIENKYTELQQCNLFDVANE
jgi:hypothetical protein